MAINVELYNSPAKRGDISGTAINTSIALTAIAEALEAIRMGGQPTAQQIATIREKAEKLSSIFDSLTGWTPDER